MTEPVRGEPPSITTPRLRLQAIRESDAERLWPFVSDPTLSELMSWDAHRSLAETHAFIADVRQRMTAGSNATWVVEAAGAACGIVSLIGILRTHRALTYDRGELAYWLGRDFRGNGYATEAVAAVVRCGFEELGLHKITVAHVTENDGSRNLIKRLGFRRVGTERAHFAKHGRWFDHVIYELLRTTWAARR